MSNHHDVKWEAEGKKNYIATLAKPMSWNNYIISVLRKQLKRTEIPNLISKGFCFPNPVIVFIFLDFQKPKPAKKQQKDAKFSFVFSVSREKKIENYKKDQRKRRRIINTLKNLPVEWRTWNWFHACESWEGEGREGELESNVWKW